MKLFYKNVFAVFIFNTAMSDAATPILSLSDFSGQLSGQPIGRLDGTASTQQGNVITDSVTPALDVIENNENLAYEGNSFVSISKNAGNNIVSENAVAAVQTIAFELGVNEIVNIDFTADYAFTFTDSITGSISWELVGPSSNPIFFGSVPSGANSISASEMGVSGAGVYTLTITTSLEGVIQTEGASSTASLSNIEFDVIQTAIPEPSTMCALLLGLSAFVGRRRR